VELLLAYNCKSQY